jgi:hypothetical protein
MLMAGVLARRRGDVNGACVDVRQRHRVIVSDR